MWTLAVQNSDELIYIGSFEPLEKMHDFQGYFSDFPGPQAVISRTIQDQSDFPRLCRSYSFQEKKIQDIPGGVGSLKNPERETLATDHFDLGCLVVGVAWLLVGASSEHDGNGRRTDFTEVGAQAVV